MAVSEPTTRYTVPYRSIPGTPKRNKTATNTGHGADFLIRGRCEGAAPLFSRAPFIEIGQVSTKCAKSLEENLFPEAPIRFAVNLIGAEKQQIRLARIRFRTRL